ncbi:MAG: TonB-dependent receptor domain-containing protein, partial [Flavobacteriaceae bacterium]
MLFLGLSMAGHFLIHAQQTSQTTTITLAEVTLQAPQLETSRFSLPASVSVINWAPLQGFQQQLSLQEYLRAVPGLFTLNATNYAQDLRLSIRGFGSRAAFGIRGVKIIVDGIPETTPDGQGQVDNLPLGLLGTIEVLRGPSASLYGNAAGGVLYLNTLDDLQGEALRVRISLGAYGFQNHQLSTSFNKGKTTGFLHFSKTKTVGFRTFSGIEQSLFNAKIKQQFNAKSQLNFQVNYTYSPRAEDPGGLTLEEAEADFRQARQRNLEYDTFEKINQLKIGARWNYKLRTQWNFETYGFYSMRDFYGKLPFEQGGVIDLFRNYYGLGARLKFKEVGSQLTHRWQLGIDSHAQADQRDRYLNLQGTQGEQVFSQLEQFGTAGLVLLDELQWEKLLLRTGLRLDHQRLGADTVAEDQRYTVLNPSIGMSYALAPRQRLFVNFSTSFETPTLSELTANPSGEVGFNSSLLPAKAINYEGGWKSKSAKGSFELTAFYIQSTNEILPYELE